LNITKSLVTNSRFYQKCFLSEVFFAKNGFFTKSGFFAKSGFFVKSGVFDQK